MCLFAQAVDRPGYGPVTNDFLFQMKLSREVRQHQANQHGQQSLTGDKNHDRSGSDQYDANHILEKYTDAEYRRVRAVLAQRITFVLDKVVLRDLKDCQR